MLELSIKAFFEKVDQVVIAWSPLAQQRSTAEARQLSQRKQIPEGSVDNQVTQPNLTGFCISIRYSTSHHRKNMTVKDLL